MRLWISVVLLSLLCVACETEKPKTTSNLEPQNKPEIISYTPNLEKSKKKVITVNRPRTNNTVTSRKQTLKE